MVRPMKKAFAPILALAACLLAAGCTDSDWNHLLNYGGMGEDEAAPAPVQPAATAAAEPAAAAAPASPTESGGTDFCRNVAMEDATSNGFDKETQQRVFQRSYQQCVAIYAR